MLQHQAGEQYVACPHGLPFKSDPLNLSLTLRMTFSSMMEEAV